MFPLHGHFGEVGFFDNADLQDLFEGTREQFLRITNVKFFMQEHCVNPC